MTGKGIAVAGSLICDNYNIIDTYPRMGRLTNIRSIDRGVGGTGNLILDLAKLDAEIEVKVSAIIGSGSNGRFIKQTLEQYPNINLEGLVIEGETSMTMVMEGMDNKQRTFFYLAGGSDVYDESYIEWDKIDADIFQLEYLLLLKKVDEEDPEYGTHGARILCEAQKRGMKTSIDVVSDEDEMRIQRIVRPALKYTDYCIVNEVEAQGITGVQLLDGETLVEENLERALRSLGDWGVSTWAVIHSPTCSYGLDVKNQEIIKVPSLCLPEGYIKGTTGAGDAFCSGILYSAYQGFGLRQALRVGASCAACSLSKVGGSEGLRSYEEVMKEYEKYNVEEER